MQAYTYLLINFLTIIICFIFSFDRRIQFNTHFSAFLKGSILVAVPFIAWDVHFTNTGVWWFNGAYTLPFRIGGLPIEEWLFFICIPFSCVFTYFCLDKFFNLNWANRFNGVLTWTIFIGCGVVAVLFNQKIYPYATALITGGTVFYLYYIGRATWIGKGTLVYILLLPGFFMVNGVLTGTGLESPIVNYNSDQILNMRMLTIPVEDAFYGYAQFMLNIYFFKLFQRKN